jgi:hypothetical protein
VQPSPTLGVGQIVPGAAPERKRYMATAEASDVVAGRRSELLVVIGAVSIDRQAKRVVAECERTRAAHALTSNLDRQLYTFCATVACPAPPVVQQALAAPAAPRAEYPYLTGSIAGGKLAGQGGKRGC